MTEFTEKVITVIRAIPEGKVMTYGQVAAEAGSPRAARQVVRILHSMSAPYKLPWHRVIGGKGELRLPDGETLEEQLFLLAAEGVEVTGRRYVDLERYGYRT
ncbi:MGMT family protein [Paenibacillus chartarius]|uniref:MGMT family protein n=1 Tax=Paenibacillus chartarius TaxID=747481 RepID=A0ABV6DPB5_9BACL